MSWTTTPTSGISVSGWNYNYDSIRSSTTTSATFALHENGGANDIGSTHDIEFRIENGNLVLDVNPGTNSANPNAFTHQPSGGTVSSQVTSATVNVGDTIRLYTAVNGSLNGSFVISSEFDITASSSGGGTSTEEVSFPSGSLSKVTDNLGRRFIVYSIHASSPTTSTGNGFYNVRYTLKDGTTGNNFTNGIPHTYGSATNGNFGMFSVGTTTHNDTPDGLYELIHTGSSLNNFPITVLASVTLSRGKVFCNFW